MKITGTYHEAMGAIADALGLKDCRWLRLTLSVGEAMIVEAECYPETDGVLQTGTILRKFELVEKE